MPGRKLSPQDIEAKQIIADRLNNLLKKSGYIKKDVNQQTNIPNSTLTGYFKGTRLPAPENVEKLAKFFNVDKSEIDPRFATSAPKFTNDDLDAMLDNAHSYDGKPLDDHDRELIRQYLKALLNK